MVFHRHKKKDNKCLPWRLAESKSSPSQVAIYNRKKEKKNLACQKKLEVRIKVWLFSPTYFAISDSWSFPSLLESKTCNIVSVYWISSSSDTSWLFLASRSKSRRKFWNGQIPINSLNILGTNYFKNNNKPISSQILYKESIIKILWSDFNKMLEVVHFMR